MKTDASEDLELRGLLREWTPDATLSPRFQDAVWRRIEHAEAASAPAALAWWEKLLQPLLQPKWATAGLLAVVLLGGLSGFRSGADPAKRAAQDRYIAAVDPFQKGR